MSYCWWCYWGWPKPIADIYKRAEADIDDLLAATEENDWAWPPDEPCSGERALKFGPAHVVWCDENWDCAESCLKDCDTDIDAAAWYPGTLDILRRSLRELMAVSEELKNTPKGFGSDVDNRPEDYPPTHGVEMVKDVG